MSLFAGTAHYYDTFRPDMPDEACDYVLGLVKPQSKLLDLGTGTGRVLEQLAPHFAEAIAVEPDHDMAMLARQRLRSFPVRIFEAAAEDVELPDDWRPSLVTIVRAFHWMDREVVLRKLDAVVAPDGVIAIMSDRSFWNLGDPWAETVRQVITAFLGPERRTTQGTYQRPSRDIAEDFATSAFSRVNTHHVPLTRHWTTDQIIGYLYSTSFASKALLGNQAERFEQELRKQLRRLSADNFIEHNEFEIIIARRP